MNVFARYGFAVLTISVAIVLTSALADLLAPMRLFFLWVGVLITAVVAGAGPGLLAILLSVLAAAYLVFAPIGSFAVAGTEDFLRLTLFATFATAISLAVGVRRRAEQRAELSEQRYRTLVEATPVPQAVWTATPDGRIQWTDRWRRITGQTRTDEGLRNVHPDDAARTAERWQAAVAQGTYYEDEVRVRVANGRYRWFAIRAVPVREGDRVREWVGIAADIHDRKRHEEEAALLLRASEALASSLGYDQTLRNLERVIVPELAATCDVRIGESAPGIPMIAHGKTLGTLVLTGLDEEDRPLVEELARRGAIALENARLYEAAEAANRAKDEFLATLSHELRTPLTAITGWAHMMQLGMTDEKTSKLAVETILRSAKAQGELIDDLLDLSRVVAGTLHLSVVDVDLPMVVQDAIAAARPAAEAKGIALHEATAAGATLVRGDERRIRQIIWNLLSNAVKFTDDGGSITVSVTASDSKARIEVADTGRGIDPSFLPHVWDRFRQADSSTSRIHGGLGLGLSVVRHLVELHGGTVRAESDGLGRGARFIVEFPRARAGEAASSPYAGKGKTAALSGKRILVVDDDDDARLVLATMLRQYGADVLAVPSVEQAVRAIGETAFHVIVSDIAMPGEDGYALVRRLRGLRAVPVVAVSAISTGADDRRRAIDAGFADFVRKPVDSRQLAVAVAAAAG
ncbi:MAG: ATP-binding protein [Thermoanaerobaculia bacterium]